MTAPFTAGPAYIPVRVRSLPTVHLVRTADDNPFLSTRALRALCGQAATQWDRAEHAAVTCLGCLQARDGLEAQR